RSAALASGGNEQPIDREIAELQARATTSPRRRETLEQLGYLFVNRARLANDPGAYTLAERVAICVEQQNPGDPAALLLRGHALHQLHRFYEAGGIALTLIKTRELI